MIRLAGIIALIAAISAANTALSETGLKGPLDFVPVQSGPEECFQYGLDIIGTDLNNGLVDKVNSAQECLALCQQYAGAQYFTWSSASFSDPNYQLTCWCTPDNQGTNPSPETVSGPLQCGPQGGCCNGIQFSSTGWIATSKPSHILGYYSKFSMGANGRWAYQQQGGLNHFLYFIDSLNIWFIGDAIGSNTGYASNTGTAQCPEDIAVTWEAWSPNANEWLLDPAAYMTCRNGIIPSPEQINASVEPLAPIVN